jgi:ABC-type glycerol-3-phosphate transport system substrate-binding protein
MSRLDRRTFLKGAGMLGASTLAGAGARSARADKPINLSGWVFKPDTVKDYVDFYNKKHGGQVKYEAIPWAQYHPTMETRSFAGEIVDVMYCASAGTRTGSCGRSTTCRAWTSSRRR